MSTILIVEDHKVTLSSLCLILSRRGYDCLSADTAKLAEELFAQNVVDLVLLDYSLPDVDGGTLAGSLREKRNVPVVMISGDGQLRDQPEAVDVLFPKPTDPNRLLEAIAELLRKPPAPRKSEN